MAKRVLIALIFIPVVVASLVIQLPWLAIKWVINGGEYFTEEPWFLQILETKF